MKKEKQNRAPSILQPDGKYCYMTFKRYGVKVDYGLHCHHIYPGKNRQVSDENGFWVWLRPYWHTGSNIAVHGRDGAALDHELKEECQRAYEAEGNSRESFRTLIGRSYL